MKAAISIGYGGPGAFGAPRWNQMARLLNSLAQRTAGTEMAKLYYCDRCQLCAHSPDLVCGLYPEGVEGDNCLDFRPSFKPVAGVDDPLAWYSGGEWSPDEISYYAGDLIFNPGRMHSPSVDEQNQLLDSHPLFTGRCPHCEMPIQQTDPPRVHCDWVDDLV